MKKIIVAATVVGVLVISSGVSAQARYDGFSALACWNYYQAFFPYTVGLEC